MSSSRPSTSDAMAGGGRRRPPLGYQVILGTAGLVVLLLVVGAVSVAVLVHLRSDELGLDESVPYTNAVATASLNAKGIANDQRGFLLTGNRQYLEEIATRAASASAAFEVARTTAPDTRHRQIAEAAQQGFERWLSAVQSEVALYQSGDHQAATAASLADRAQRKAYERSLAEAQSLGVGSIRAGDAAETAAFRRGLVWLLTCLGLALVVSAVTATWLVRSIALPVYRLAAIFAP